MPLKPLPPLRFHDLVARAHVVCSINAIVCGVVGFIAAACERQLRWDWTGGVTVGATANLVLFLVLIAVYPRRTGPAALLRTLMLCIMSLLVAATGSIEARGY